MTVDEKEIKTLSWLVCPSCNEKICVKAENCTKIAELHEKLKQKEKANENQT